MDGDGAISVTGKVERRSPTERAIRIAAARGSLQVITADFAQSLASPLASLTTEQPWCGIVNRACLNQLWMSLATMFLLTDTDQPATCTPSAHTDDLSDEDEHSPAPP